MESINLVLSIVASVLSIIATFSAYKRKKEIGRLRDLYEGNGLDALGDGNAQVVGSGNRVSTHVGR